MKLLLLALKKFFLIARYCNRGNWGPSDAEITLKKRQDTEREVTGETFRLANRTENSNVNGRF